MSKRILSAVVVLLLAITGYSQTTVVEAKKLRALDSLYINGQWINYVITDTSLSAANHRNITSAEAIKSYVLNRLAFAIKTGDTAAMLQGYARVQRVLDSLTAVQSRIQSKLTKADADTYYPAIQRLIDSMTAVQARVQTKLTKSDADTYYPAIQRLIDSMTAVQARVQTKLTKSDADTYYPAIQRLIDSATAIQARIQTKQPLLGYTAENSANKATDFSTLNNTLYPTVQAVSNYTQSALTGVLKDRGNYDASGNVFPSSGGSGSGGAIKIGDMWYISVGGTLGGKVVTAGAWVRALTDAPGQTAGNWAIADGGFGFTPANSARTLTINGATYDLTANRSWSVGTVTSVGVSVPTGLSVTSGSPVTTSGTIAIGLQSGYSIPTTSDQTNWNSAYGWGNHASAGYSTASNTQTFTNKTWNGVPIANAYLANSSVTVNAGTDLSGGGSVTLGSTAITLNNVSTLSTVMGRGASSSTNISLTGRDNSIGTVHIGRSGGDYGTIGYNVAFTASDNTWNYAVSDYASFIRFHAGGFSFWTAPAGTGGVSMTATNVGNISQGGVITGFTWQGGAIADSYIASASSWNTAYSSRITTVTATNLTGSYSGNTLTISLNGTQVNNALGYTAANNASLANYLPLAGGTLSGNLTINNGSSSYLYGQTTNSFVRLDNSIGAQIGYGSASAILDGNGFTVKTSSTTNFTVNAGQTYVWGTNSSNSSNNGTFNIIDAATNTMASFVGYRGANGNDGNLRLYTGNAQVLAQSWSAGGKSSINTTSLSAYAYMAIDGNDNQFALGTGSTSQTAGLFFADGSATNSSNYKWEIHKNSSNNLQVYSYGTGSNIATFNYSSGLLTLSNGLTVNGGNITSGVSGGGFYHSVADAGVYADATSISLAGWSNSLGMHITLSTGAASFNSTVTATGFIGYTSNYVAPIADYGTGFCGGSQHWLRIKADNGNYYYFAAWSQLCPQ